MSNKYFKQFDLLHIGIFIIDEDYRVVFWNKIISDWTNIKPEAILRKSIIDFFPNLSKRKYTRRLNWILTGGPPIIFSPQLHPYLIKCPLSNNRNRIVKTTVSTIGLEKKKKLLIFSVEDMTQPIEQIQEISKLRQSALNEIRERKKIESELLLSRKFESIALLTHGFAHDFNNILAVISGNISLLSTKQNLNNEAEKIMEKIENSVFKASDLANVLISFATNDETLTDRTTLNFTELISNIEKYKNKKKVKLNIYIADGLFLISGNENQLLNMFNNLVTNSFESIKSEGNINITAKNSFINDTKHLHYRKGKYIKITIEDNGCGIPEENLDRVFDPYFTTKNEVTKKGLGFGLSIARSTINKHRGYITITSKDQIGTTITIMLPAAETA